MSGNQGKKRPASYFIDYENVRGAGLDGVENLGKHDRVTVLYGSKDSALKLHQVQNILNSPAKVEFIKVATGKHDALDFQLVALLFMKMKKKRDYYIISRDTGFDFAIRMAKERGMERVFRRETISGAALQPKQLPGKRSRPMKGLPQPTQPEQASQPETASSDADAPKPSRSAKRRSRKSSSRGKKPQKDTYRLEVERMLAKHLGGLPPAKRVEVLLAGLAKCENKARFYNFLRGNLGNEQGLALYRDVKGCFEQLRAIPRDDPASDAPEAGEAAPAE